jgi:outer membrane protein
MMKTFNRLVMVMWVLLPAPALAQAPAAPGVAPMQLKPVELKDVRVACFSPQRAFSESAEGKAGMAKLAALQSEKARQIEEKNKALQLQEQTLQQNAAVLSQEARIRRSRELDQFRIDVQRFIQDAQAEVTGLQRELETAFLFKLRPAVEKVAKERGLQLIFDLDATTVAWAEPSLDITADVITQLARAAATSK